MFTSAAAWAAGLVLALGGLALVWAPVPAWAGWTGVGMAVAGAALVWRAVL